MTIEETMEIEIPDDIESDHPDAAAEYRVQQIQRGLIEFIWEITSEHCASAAECAVVRSNVALSLMQSFNNKLVCELLKERVLARIKEQAVTD